jgi:hypothetical protein
MNVLWLRSKLLCDCRRLHTLFKHLSLRNKGRKNLRNSARLADLRLAGSCLSDYLPFAGGTRPSKSRWKLRCHKFTLLNLSRFLFCVQWIVTIYVTSAIYTLSMGFRLKNLHSLTRRIFSALICYIRDACSTRQVTNTPTQSNPHYFKVDTSTLRRSHLSEGNTLSKAPKWT